VLTGAIEIEVPSVELFGGGGGGGGGGGLLLGGGGGWVGGGGHRASTTYNDLEEAGFEGVVDLFFVCV
jgi:hypothetical protein